MSAPLVIVAGSPSTNYRNGGISWVWLSWALGLRRLGMDVFLLDELDRDRCVHARGTEQTYDTCLNRTYFEQVVRNFGLERAAAIVGENGESVWGLGYRELLELAGEAILLVNIAGNLRMAELKARPKIRAFLDIDPGFTQLWLARGGSPRIDGHDLYFTVGENVGARGCSLPTGRVRWLRTRQPVLLDEWPAETAHERTFTTVARWRGSGPYGDVGTLGVSFDSKGDGFTNVLELPRRTGSSFEVALDGDREARNLLERHGWRVVDPDRVASDPLSFRRYVQSSWAEFSVAKGAYVETRSGWFSDRTTRYLASGKPALVQDTGFGLHLPVGEGLLAFATIEEAVEGAETIASDYDRHSAAARRIAEEHFASDVVLTRFLEDAGI